MNRRNFIAKTGASALLATVGKTLLPTEKLGDWEDVRSDFNLDTSKIQMPLPPIWFPVC